MAYKFIKDDLPCALNADVDINGYEPVTFEELLQIIIYGMKDYL